MSPPLPRYLEDKDPDKLNRIIRQTTTETITITTVTRATLPGDTRRLRGIPVQAKGVGGTSPGTDPLGTLINKQRYQSRRINRA